MTTENTIRSLLFGAATLAASSNVNANEARIATQEQITALKQMNDNAVFSSKADAEDWYHQKKLIDAGQATVLIQPAKNNPGFCEYGLDGFPQVYNPTADKRTLDGKLEKAEIVLNGTNDTFLFPCDLKAEPETVTPNIVLVPGPGEVIEKKVPAAFYTIGLGYNHIFGNPDEYGLAGQLPGGEISFTVQPRDLRFYAGGYFALNGNRNSDKIVPLADVPATEGPLAGQLVLKGENHYDITTVAIGIGPIIGGDVYRKNKFALGLEGSTALHLDLSLQDISENSHYEINGQLVEGSNASDPSDELKAFPYLANRIGLRLKLPNFFVAPHLGFRTNFADHPFDPIAGVTLGYNSKSE